MPSSALVDASDGPSVQWEVRGVAQRKRIGFGSRRSPVRIRPPRPEAKLLRISEGAPVLLVEGVSLVDPEVPADPCSEVYRE